MGRSLVGHSVLVIEDEPVIALDIAYAFECAGACVVISRSLNGALALVEADGWVAAVLDPASGDGESSRFCERLKKRDIPIVLYTGYRQCEGACRDGIRVSRQAGPALLVRAVEELVQGRSISN